MRLMAEVLRRYPRQSVVMLLALLCAGLAEGLSLGSLAPMLGVAVGGGAGGGAALADAGTLPPALLHWLDGLGFAARIGTLLGIIVGGLTLKNLLLLCANRQVGLASARFATDLRLGLLGAVLRGRWDYFVHQPVGRLSNALATEVQRSATAVVDGSRALTFLIQALIYAGVALAVSWRATLVCVGVGVLVLGLTSLLVRAARRSGSNQTLRLRALVTRLTDALQSVKALKAMSREHLVVSVLAAETTRLDAALRAQVASTAALAAAQEQMFAVAIGLGMFVALVYVGMPFATVLVLVLVLGRMLSQCGKVQKEYQRLVIGESAYAAIVEALAEARRAEEAPGGTREPTLERGIRIEALRFARGTRELFEGITLEIRAGSLTTLTGASGCGKTTLVDMIIGLVRPCAGRITVDDVALGELDLRAWRHMIGYVPQENLLLHDTILDNVTLGDPALGAADAERALREAGAWEFVAALPDGVRHVVGERGGTLSGGQRQRIMIARALVNRPRLLVLDEATSALDAEAEAAICATLARLRGRLTIVAITHREAMARIADRVYRLDAMVHAAREGGAVQLLRPANAPYSLAASS